MTDMVSNAAAISRIVDLPVVADADTGYGNDFNVTLTIQEDQRAGVAAFHIEDQAAPKRRGHLDGEEFGPPRRSQR